MPLTLAEIQDQARSELNVTRTLLPDDLLTSYANLVQLEVAQRLGPIIEASFRKRATLTGAYSVGILNDGSGTYDHEDAALLNVPTIDGFTGLTVDAHIGDWVIFEGTWTTVKGYKDIIVDNTATKIVLAENTGISADTDGADVQAIVFSFPQASDPASAGFELPSDCMRPLYLADNAIPSSEGDRIDVIQLDDTENVLENTYWDSEIGGAVQIGNVLHVLKGSSASYPTTVVLTYVQRPADYSASTDAALLSEHRLPEEYFGIMRAGILKLAAMHLKRRDEMQMAGEDMNARIASIHTQWGLSQAVEREQEATR